MLLGDVIVEQVSSCSVKNCILFSSFWFAYVPEVLVGSFLFQNFFFFLRCIFLGGRDTLLVLFHDSVLRLFYESVFVMAASFELYLSGWQGHPFVIIS